jgi:hypothetical protein
MEQHTIKPMSKSEWFEFPSPIGEPNIEWDNKYPYEIERLVKDNGDICWFGQVTNWVKEKGKGWTYLGVDENVKPTVFIKGEDGFGDYAEYPEGRSIFIPCEPPIYEVLYSNLKQ